MSRCWMLVMLVVGGLALVSCKTGSSKGNGTDLEKQPPIEAESREASERFERGRRLLEEGDFEGAREAFRLVQAEHGSDPVADVAEVYIARSFLGEVEPGGTKSEEDEDKRNWREAAQILAPLVEEASLDRRVHFGAVAYLALAQVLGGRLEEAMETLSEYPGASLSEVVLPTDRSAVYVLLVERFHRADRATDQMEASAALHAELVERSVEGERGARADDRLEVEQPPEEPMGESGEDAAAPEGLESLLALSRQRAFEAAEEVGEGDLRDYLMSDERLLRASAGWGYLGSRLEEEVDIEEREVLEDLFNEIAPDLVEVGASERAAEMSMRLASVGGPKRLAIGCLLPLSGSTEAIGERVMAGALVAMRAFQDAGHPEVTLVFEDSEGDPSEAFERLVEQEVLAVVGPVDVRRARRFAPLAREAGIPLITLTTEAAIDPPEPEDEDAEPLFVFRNFIDAAAEARAAARIAFEEIGDRRAAVVYPDVGYGRVTTHAFTDEFRELGGSVVAEIEYDRSASDFSDIASRVADAEPEAIFLPDSAEKVAEVTSFFANENIWGLDPEAERPRRARRTLVHYLGTSLWEHPMLLRQASSYVEGASIPVWFSSAVSEEPVEQFVGRFEAIYGRQPQNFEAFSYDTVNWLKALMLERGMRRPEAIRDALMAGDVHRGVTGRAQMTERADAARALRFVTPTSEGFEMLPFRGEAVRRAEDDEQPDLEGLDESDDASSPPQPRSQ